MRGFSLEEILKIIRDYAAQFFTKKFKNLDETDNFLEIQLFKTHPVRKQILKQTNFHRSIKEHFKKSP